MRQPRLPRWLVVPLVLSGLISPSVAFFPTPWKEVVFGAGGVSHMEQTDQAFQTLASKYFPTIDHLSNTMIKARDAISLANAEVDNDQDHSALHCDGENLDGAQDRLQTLHDEVISKLNDKDVEGARKSLGSALHTVQDFYAHSNYVEMGNTGPSDVLGRAPTIAHAGPADQTCKACDTTINPLVCNDCSQNEAGFLGLLTSGYYFGEDSPPGGAEIPSFKCHHGGFTDNSFGGAFGFIAGKATQGINKDSLNCGFSPHYYAHSDAVRLSIAATEQYIDDIKLKISQSQLRQLFGVGPTLAFCIDTTGSMSDVIASVREQSIAIVTERIGTADEPSSYVISSFNDPGVGPVTQTSDFDEFKSVISGLTASGGGDCPELSMQGILNALAVLDDDSTLFLFTDADSKDFDLAGQVIDIAKSKNVNIYIFKFDSNCDDGALKKRVDSGANAHYNAVALGTSGQYHSLPRAEVGSVKGTIDTLTSVDNSFILKIIQVLPPNGTTTYGVPVDSLMTELSISLRGSTASMVVNTPGGTPLDLTGTGVSNVVLTDGDFLTVQKPSIGTWTVAVTASGNYTLDATGISGLHFSSFVFSQLTGRPGHKGFFPISGLPPYNSRIAAIGGIDGDFQTAEFDFRTPAGDLVRVVPMTQGSGEHGDPPANSFFSLLTLTPADQFVYLSGLDSSGKAYQRVLPSVITPIFSNETFNTNTTTLPGNGTSSTISISSSSAPYGNKTTTSCPPTTLPSSRATVTEVVYTTLTTCPVTIGTHVVSGSTSYEISLSTSTVRLTSTSTIPCHGCSGYPIATPTKSHVYTVSEIHYTTTSPPPTTYGTNISGVSTDITTSSPSVMTLISTSIGPCESCSEGASSITVVVTPESTPVPTNVAGGVESSVTAAAPAGFTGIGTSGSEKHVVETSLMLLIMSLAGAMLLF